MDRQERECSIDGRGGEGPAIISGFMPLGRVSCAGVWSCSEHSIFHLVFLLGHGLDRLGIKQW